MTCVNTADADIRFKLQISAIKLESVTEVNDESEGKTRSLIKGIADPVRPICLVLEEGKRFVL